MEFFERQWSSYRAVVENDLMEHRAVATATGTALRHWLAQRPATATPPALLDLGCGPGFASLGLAERVGAGGQVLAIDSAPAYLEHLEQLDGAMVGRAAYAHPLRWAEVDQRVFGNTSQPPARASCRG